MKPVIKQSSAEKVFRYFFGDEWKAYECIELAIRSNANKINIFDDELYVFNRRLNIFRTFNWNADPSAYRIGGDAIAILRNGVHFYTISYHHIGENNKRYVALRPRTPRNAVPVWRMDAKGNLTLSTGFALNQHAGGDRTTGSRGCQTAPRSQYGEFITFVGDAFGVKVPLGVQPRPDKRLFDGIGKIPYVLVTQAQFNYILNLPEDQFDSPADLSYQLANFANIPKIERVKPVIASNPDAPQIIGELEGEAEIENSISLAASDDSDHSNDPAPVQDPPTPVPAPETPQTQVICKERPSTFVRIGTVITGAIGTITAFGINLQAIIQNKLEQITPAQILFAALGLGLVALAIYLYDRSANRANALNQQKLSIAGNRNLITTELNANYKTGQWMNAALSNAPEQPLSVTNCEK